MISILFYGNCQPAAIQNTLCLDTKKYSTTYIQCHKTEIIETAFLKHILESDIIITQPITDDYRNMPHLSTSFIVNNAKKTTKIILFNNCYFDFYYFDLTYKKYNGVVLNKPSDYHYKNMIECCKNKIPAEKYIEDYVNNIDIKTSEELENIAEKSLMELTKRYHTTVEKYNNPNVHVIPIHDFIKENYKKKLLFYSMNHPTKYVIQYVCEEIINHLKMNNTINYKMDGLNNTKCILYKCIQKNVQFDITEYNPSINKETDLLKITNMYYDAYHNLEDISKL